MGAGEARVFSPTEKELVIEQAKKMAKVQVGSKPDYAGVARELQRLHPTLFGRGAPGMQDGGIGRQVVRQIVTRAPKGEVSDARGRPPALPQACLLMIMAAFTSVVSVRATLVSAPMLQPIAIAIIISAGHGGLLHEGRKRRGVFVCSVNFIRELIKERGWKNVRPCGDTRKVPDNYVTLRWLMVLRLAYFVLVHSIPHELCLNGDHTGIMFTLAKGKMWITKAMHESKDKSVNNHGEKRQFTVLATTSAAGQMLPHQVVVAGKTAGSLPKFGKFKISLNGMNTNKVPKLAVCFVLTTLVQAVAHAGGASAEQRRVQALQLASDPSIVRLAAHLHLRHLLGLLDDELLLGGREDPRVAGAHGARWRSDRANLLEPAFAAPLVCVVGLLLDVGRLHGRAGGARRRGRCGVV